MWVSGVAMVMVALEILEVGMNTVNKAAMSRGLSNYVLVVYSNILAIFLLLSSSFIVYRKRTIPQLKPWILCKIFVLGLLSCTGQVVTYLGIEYSSPTLASAMIDLTPGFTFLLAIISRMERMDLRIKSSQAKSIGTVVLIAGGLIVTLYKGIPIISNPSSSNQLTNKLLRLQPSKWAIGGFLLATHSFTLAQMYIMLTSIMRDYPAELLIVLINSIFVSILSAIVCLIAEKDPNAWKIKPDIELIAIGYSAAFAVALRTAAHTWACHKKGPVYASMFKPLGMVIAALMGVFFLGDTLYLGSLIGAVIIAMGFYAVIWGKAQEEKTKTVEDTKTCGFEPTSPNAPLLENKSAQYV